MHRAALERQARVLPPTGNPWCAAALLVAQERQRTWVVEGEKRRQLRETGPGATGLASILAAVRDAVGSTLIRAGGRLRGGADPARGPGVAPGA
jgi:hypothetical protein